MDPPAGSTANNGNSNINSNNNNTNNNNSSSGNNNNNNSTSNFNNNNTHPLDPHQAHLPHHQAHHDPHVVTHQYRSEEATASAAAALRHRLQQQQQQQQQQVSTLSTRQQHASPAARFQPSPGAAVQQQNPSPSPDHDHAMHHISTAQHLTSGAMNVGNVGNLGNIGNMGNIGAGLVGGVAGMAGVGVGVGVGAISNVNLAMSSTAGPSSLIAPQHQTAQTPSSPTLWQYFKRGDKMQKTNKFEANCIFCLERQGILTKVRGEKRMMSGHLRNCPNASDTAKAEGEAVAIELKNRRTSANRIRHGHSHAHNRDTNTNNNGNNNNNNGNSNSNGNNNNNSRASAHQTNLGITPTMRKKVSKGRINSIHNAAASGNIMTAVAMAAAASGAHNITGAGNANSLQPSININSPAVGNTPEANYFKSVQATPAFVTNDGIRLFYEERGRGHPLILIHGWSGTSKYFVRNFTTLADSFRVIQFDLRGHGESEKPTWGFHVHRLAADLQNLMDHLQLHNVAVLGCSLGSAVIWAYVELFGVARISAAMFVDQSPWQMVAPDGSWQYGSSGAFSESAIACLSAKLEENPRSCHVKNVQMCLNRDPTPHESEFFVNEAMKSQPWFLSKLMSDHSNIDWRSVLPCVTCPALVIVGKNSKVFPWQGVAYAAEKMPNATLITFDEGSHWLYYEEADKFNAVVTTWLQKLHPQS